MNDRHDQKEQPKGNHLRLCQRLAELEGEAGPLEIDADKLTEEAQSCTLAEAINDGWMFTPKSGHRVKLRSPIFRTVQGRFLPEQNEFFFGCRTSLCT